LDDDRAGETLNTGAIPDGESDVGAGGDVDQPCQGAGGGRAANSRDGRSRQVTSRDDSEDERCHTALPGQLNGQTLGEGGGRVEGKRLASDQRGEKGRESGDFHHLD